MKYRNRTEIGVKKIYYPQVERFAEVGPLKEAAAQKRNMA